MVVLSLHCCCIIFLSTTLERISFEINPNHICVANNMVEVTQFTISWYVDDNKLSHKNSSVLSDIINKVKKHFRYLSFVRGKRNTLFGMKIEIKNNIIQVDMIKQLEDLMSMFGEDVSKSV